MEEIAKSVQGHGHPVAAGAGRHRCRPGLPPGLAPLERLAQQDAIRRDRALVLRYPNEAAHLRARNAALDDATKAKAATTAMMFSRTNTLLSIAMLYCMISAESGY